MLHTPERGFQVRLVYSRKVSLIASKSLDAREDGTQQLHLTMPNELGNALCTI